MSCWNIELKIVMVFFQVQILSDYISKEKILTFLIGRKIRIVYVYTIPNIH